jgi:serine/threonine protein kinase
MTIISQFLMALKRIHESGFIHGDLKCANIFLANRYVPGDYKNIKVKIGDFGLSELGGDLVFGGTPGFMAPEVPLIGGSFDSDIYSAGKVMLEIMTQLPVKMIQVIDSLSVFTLKYKLPKFMDITQYYDIVITCLNIDFKKRPSASTLCNLFNAILTLWILGEDTNLLIYRKYRLGETVPVDSHEHPLIVSNAEMRGYNGDGWYCSICQNKDKSFFNNMISFQCKRCEYDLCYTCILKHDYRVVNEKMSKISSKGRKVYVTTHPHYLLLKRKEERYKEKDNSWTCDICQIRACESVYSFHCKDCEYDVCLKCFDKNFEIRGCEKICCIIF